jgi:chemotaxis protein methyltransferase CheR
MDDTISPTDLIEAEALTRVVEKAYGYDFHDYAQVSHVRRLRSVAQQFGCESLSQLQHLLLHDPTSFTRFLSAVNISVTDFFRDGPAYVTLKAEVIPFLATYGRLKVWHAGCASGEELYSLAIMLEHAGILGRARLYGTDISPDALSKAREGLFKREHVQKGEAAYAALGYGDTLTEHFTENFGSALIDKRYRERALFSDHNLVSDANFGTFELIVCRNVFIYFDQQLQLRVLELFRDALEPGGYLWLGLRETMIAESSARDFECVDRNHRLFRRRRT